jgi:hypothetical protein
MCDISTPRTPKARAIADIVGARMRNFTTFSPRPPVGTVEIWLAGSAQRPTAARARAPATQQSTPQDQALLLLRDKLVKSLRRGDHL